MTTPIDLYYWPTPNGWKISIALEELGLPYEVKPVDIGRGDQFEPDFLEISPNNKMPAILDPHGPDGEPVSVFESGAILIYLAEKTGRLMPADPRGRIQCLEWLMFQMGGFGPMLGQLHHFKDYAPERIEYAVNRYFKEGLRLYGVLDQRLEGRDFVAGEGQGEYSIADIAIYGWAVAHEMEEIPLADFPNVKRWYEALSERPAVKAGLALLEEDRAPPDEEAKKHLFGHQDEES